MKTTYLYFVQNCFYKGLPTDYGRSNIEFEAKLLQDIICMKGDGICPEYGSTYNNQAAYITWLYEIILIKTDSMKTIYILILSLIIGSYNSMTGQNLESKQQASNEKEKKLIEKQIGNDTYLYKPSTLLVYNKKNTTRGKYPTNLCHYSLTETTPIDDIIRNTFSEKRLNKLKGNSMLINYFFNAAGEVKEIEFQLMKPKTLYLELSEIKTLEKALIGYRFKLSTECPNQELYVAVKRFKF